MEIVLSKFVPRISQDIYVKDPESSLLGMNIVKSSVDLVYDLGFEEFTFRKLGQHISSTEASIYRYFESKHKLLLYLNSWYWGWIEHQIAIKTANILDPIIRLQLTVDILVDHQDNLYQTQSIDIKKLFGIIVAESSKSYLIKNVDDLNKNGVYYNYKKLVSGICSIMYEIEPDYPYAHMLTTTVIEGIQRQIYFSEHLPSLTDMVENENSIKVFYNNLVITLLTNK